VLPATAPLTGIFAPLSDQNWVTIAHITSGVVNFSFTANPSTTARVAHVSVLERQITVTQSGLTAQNISFGTLSNQVYGTAPFIVSATASSRLTVSFASLTTAVCTVSGTTVTLVEAGACTRQCNLCGRDAGTIAMGASLCRCGDGPYVTPGSPLHNVQQNRLNRCTLKVVNDTALTA
jgi:Putative binding domain, N-terminal